MYTDFLKPADIGTSDQYKNYSLNHYINKLFI
jgi:hypothetical protein